MNKRLFIFLILVFIAGAIGTMKSQNGYWEQIGVITDEFRDDFNTISFYDENLVFMGSQLNRIISYDNRVAAGSRYNYIEVAGQNYNYRDISIMKPPSSANRFTDIGFAIGDIGSDYVIQKIQYNRSAVPFNPSPNLPFADINNGVRINITSVGVDQNNNGRIDVGETYPPNDRFHALSFAKDNWSVGWIVGQDNSDTGIIIKYTDNSVNTNNENDELNGIWSKIDANEGDNAMYPLNEILNGIKLNDVTTVNDSLAFAVGDDGVILKYDNNGGNGLNWTTVRNSNYNNAGIDIDSTGLGLSFDLFACDFVIEEIAANHYRVQGWLVGQSNIAIIYTYENNNGVVSESFASEIITRDPIPGGYVINDVSIFATGRVLVGGAANLLYLRNTDVAGDPLPPGNGTWSIPYTPNTWTFNTNIRSVAYINPQISYAVGDAGLSARITYFYYAFAPEANEVTNINPLGTGFVPTENLFLRQQELLLDYLPEEHRFEPGEVFYNSNTSWRINDILYTVDYGNPNEFPILNNAPIDLINFTFFDRSGLLGALFYNSQEQVNSSDANFTVNIPNRADQISEVEIPNDNNLMTDVAVGTIPAQFYYGFNYLITDPSGINPDIGFRAKNNFLASSNYISYSGLPIRAVVNLAPLGTGQQLFYFDIPSVTKNIKVFGTDTTIDDATGDEIITEEVYTKANSELNATTVIDDIIPLYITSTINWEGSLFNSSAGQQYDFFFYDPVAHTRTDINDFNTEFLGTPLEPQSRSFIFPAGGYTGQSSITIARLDRSEHNKLLIIQNRDYVNTFMPIIDTLQIRFFDVPYYKYTGDFTTDEATPQTDDTLNLYINREVATLSFSEDVGLEVAPDFQVIEFTVPAFFNDNSVTENPDLYTNTFDVKVFSNTSWQPDEPYYSSSANYNREFYWELDVVNAGDEVAPPSVLFDTVITVTIDSANYLSNPKMSEFRVYLTGNDVEYHEFTILQEPSSFRTYTSQTDRNDLDVSSSDTIIFNNLAGNVEILNIQANNFWVLDTSIDYANWLDYEGDTFTNHSITKSINFQTNSDINTSTIARIDSFIYSVARLSDSTFEDDFVKYKLYVVQPGAELDLDATDVELQPTLNSTATINLSSNTNWYVVYDDDFSESLFDVTPINGGIGDMEITITSKSANLSVNDFSGRLTFYTTDSVIVRTINVTQKGISLSIEFELDSDTVFFDNIYNSKSSIQFSTNFGWRLESTREGVDGFYRYTSRANTEDRTTLYTVTFIATGDNVADTFLTDSVVINIENGIVKQGFIVSQRPSFIALEPESKIIDTNALSHELTLNVKSNIGWVARLEQANAGNIVDTLGFLDDDITLQLNENYPNLESRLTRIVFQVRGVDINNATIYGTTDTAYIMQSPFEFEDNIIVIPSVGDRNTNTILVRNINATSGDSYATLLSVSGQIFESKQLVNGSTEFFVNSIPPGVYLIRVFDGKYTSVVKFLKL